MDGSQHCDPKAQAYDQARTSHLNALGIAVVRYSNLDVRNNFEGVCQHIFLALEHRGFHPSVKIGSEEPILPASPQGEALGAHASDTIMESVSNDYWQ